MSKVKKSTQDLVLTALLVAMLLLMAFTPIGYFKAGVIEITFNMIPVVIGAITVGPICGATLGAVFGITSFIQCFGASPFGATLLGINPLFTLITCLIPRILCGLISGYVYKWLSKTDRTKLLSHGAACLTGTALNTVFFTSAVLLLFGNSDYISGMRGTMNLLAFVGFFVGINGLIEAIVCTIAGTAIAKALTVLQTKIS